jgi:hypothetical protein
MLMHQEDCWDRGVSTEVCVLSEIESLEALLAKVESIDKSRKKRGEDGKTGEKQDDAPHEEKGAENSRDRKRSKPTGIVCTGSLKY